VAVSATFTATPLQEVLEFWLAELGLPGAVAFAPYGQVFQQLLDPAGVLGSNRDGMNAVLVRPEDLVRSQPAGADLAAVLRQSGEELGAALRSAADRSAVPYAVVLCPPSPAALERPDLGPELERFEAALLTGVAGVRSLHLIRPEDLQVRYPVPGAHSAGGDEVGHIPYTEEWFAAMGTALVRILHGLRSPPPKAIAVDADDTLWTGTVGEDGALRVVVDAPRLLLQRALLEQVEAGALLCLCSKNNERDVDEVLDRHPDMLLRRHHFVARRINWRPKSENLRELAEELKLALDAFIFLDDSARECGEVAAAFPEVRALTLPRDPADLPRFVRHLWVLDRLHVTDEDRRRTDLYRQEVERQRLRAASLSLADFLAGLGLEVQIAPARPEQLARVAQLTERTTQLNVNGARWTEAQLKLLEDFAGARCLAVSVKDRFGDYGLVGAMLATAEGETLRVQFLVLSCRALGRGVEHRMLAELGRLAVEQGLRWVEVPFVATPRNAPAAELLRAVAADHAVGAGAEVTYRLPAEVASRIAYVPAEGAGGAPRAAAEGAPSPAPAPAPPPAPGPRGPWRLSSEQLQDVAGELSRPRGVLARMRSRKKPRPAELDLFAAPRSALEGFLAAAWADLLGLDRVSVHDNFFELGGDSLLAAMVIARLRDDLQAALPLEALTESPTVAELARAVVAGNPERSLEIEQLASTLTPSPLIAAHVQLDSAHPREK
jgi:FkbH-like protein